MSYHPIHAVNDVILTVINDGTGSQCGFDYEARMRQADVGVFAYRAMVRQCAAAIHRPLTRAEVIEAGDILQTYYRQHVAEIARHEALEEASR